MTESEFTRKVCKQLQELGCLVFVAAGNKYGTAGWPDRHIITLDGDIYWLEFKSREREVTALQKSILAAINKRAQCTGFVVRQPDTIEYGENYRLIFDGTGRGLLACLFKAKGLRNEKL